MSNLASSTCLCYHDGQPPGATAPFCLVHLALSWRPLLTVHHELIWHSSLLSCTLEPSSMLVLIAVPCWATSLSHCPALLGSRRFRLEVIAHCANLLAWHLCQCIMSLQLTSWLTRHSEDCDSWQSMVLSTFWSLKDSNLPCML